MKAGKCQGTNRDGDPCSATPQPGKQWCVWHDPDRAEERAQWNREAGRAKSHKVQARKKVLTAGLDLGEIDAALCKALLDVLKGSLEPGVATAAATVARTISQLRTDGDFEKRLKELERQEDIRKRSA